MILKMHIRIPGLTGAELRFIPTDPPKGRYELRGDSVLVREARELIKRLEGKPGGYCPIATGERNFNPNNWLSLVCVLQPKLVMLGYDVEVEQPHDLLERWGVAYEYDPDVRY